jgi:peroxiredoxin
LATKARGLIYELEHLQPGMSAPPFSAETLDGKKVSLNDFRGKVVLLNFWATWCPSCIAEIPDLKKAVKHFDGKPFVILAVSLDDSRSMVKQFVEGAEFPGIHTWHEKGADNPVSVLYNAEMLPTWYVIDAEGIIRARDPFHEKLIPVVEEAMGNG